MEYQIVFEILGTRYRKLRLQRNMILEDVLEYGFSVRHYQQLESGRPHTMKTFFRICEMFKTDPEVMIKGILNARGPR